MAQFANTDSIAAADMNNLLRGLHRNNADSAHTGDTTKTDLSSFSMAGGTMGATGAIHILAGGTTTGTTDTKIARLELGSAVLETVSIAGGSASDWAFDIWIFNTAENAQRMILRAYEGTSTLESVNVGISTEDTSATLTVKVTGQMGGTTDTITQTYFDIFIVQIT